MQLNSSFQLQRAVSHFLRLFSDVVSVQEQPYISCRSFPTEAACSSLIVRRLIKNLQVE